MHKIILISGKAGVGKSEFKNKLSEILKTRGHRVVSAAFADEVKRIAREDFGWDGKKDEKGRKLLQQIGTDVGRSYNKDLWVKRLASFMESVEFTVDVFIIDDWRYPNEASILESIFPNLVLKIRIESPEREILKGTPEYNHTSEVALPEGFTMEGMDYYDTIITNNGDLTKLANSAVRLVDIKF